MAPFSFVHSIFHQIQSILNLSSGPSSDPNKLAPPMSQYHPPPEWPKWCLVSSNASYLIKVAFLDLLPRLKIEHNYSILDQFNDIRLQTLTHYKSLEDWNHEFIRADLVGNSNKLLIMVWERDLPLMSPKDTKHRKLRIKTGRSCQSLDRVSYLSETDFLKFRHSKNAYRLRYMVALSWYLVHLY